MKRNRSELSWPLLRTGEKGRALSGLRNALYLRPSCAGETVLQREASTTSAVSTYRSVCVCVLQKKVIVSIFQLYPVLLRVSLVSRRQRRSLHEEDHLRRAVRRRRVVVHIRNTMRVSVWNSLLQLLRWIWRDHPAAVVCLRCRPTLKKTRRDQTPGGDGLCTKALKVSKRLVRLCSQFTLWIFLKARLKSAHNTHFTFADTAK